MKVLVTGAGGFIGSALVRRLLEEGHDVRCLVHRSHNLLDGLDVEIARGDVTSSDTLGVAMRGIEVVFHLAGSGRAGDWGSRQWFFEVNTRGTKNVAEAAAEAGVRRVVHLSSLAVHTFRNYLDADETVPADQRRYPYGESKAEAERALLEVSARTGMEAVMVRPGLVVLGPNDHTAFVHMAPLLERGLWLQVGGGRRFMCYSYVENLAEGLLLCGSKPEAAGETFVITDDLRLRWHQFISALARAFGRAKREIDFPQPLARAIGVGAERLFEAAGSSVPPPATDYRTALVCHDFHFGCAKARRLLGYRPRVGYAEGLRRTVEWYRAWKKS